MSLEQRIQNESKRFHTLFNNLSYAQWSEAALPEAQSHLTACQNQARLIQDKINAFNAAAEKEHKRLNNIKGHGVKHIWYKIRGTLEQRLDEQEKTWLREFEKCKEEEQHLVIINEEIQSAQRFLQQCQSAYEDYVKNKRALDELLDHFFSGTTPSYPNEDVIEQNLKMEKERLANIENFQRNFTHVLDLLQRAYQAIIICRQSLNEALNMNTFDLFSHSSFADMAVSSYLAKARDSSTQAQHLVNEARRLYPDMPHVGNLYIKQDNLVFNIMFDNIWTDMNMRNKIREASDRIAHADAVLTNILSVVKAKLMQCEADLDTTSKNVKRLAAEHFTTRIGIVRNVIEQPPPYSSV